MFVLVLPSGPQQKMARSLFYASNTICKHHRPGPIAKRSVSVDSPPSQSIYSYKCNLDGSAAGNINNNGTTTSITMGISQACNRMSDEDIFKKNISNDNKRVDGPTEGHSALWNERTKFLEILYESRACMNVAKS